MSYDYNALVSEISLCRRQLLRNNNNDKERKESLLLQALTAFETLSKHCPMTVLLWIQYADTMYSYCISSNSPPKNEEEEEHEKEEIEDEDPTTATTVTATTTAAAMDLQLQTLELGVLEFPGSALLQLYYLELLYERHHRNYDDLSSQQQQQVLVVVVEEAIEKALLQVGKGSHCNEDVWIASIYKLQRKTLLLLLLLQQQQQQQQQQKDSTDTNGDASSCSNYYYRACVDSFIQQSRVPMRVSNDGLLHEFHEFVSEHRHYFNNNNNKDDDDENDDMIQSTIQTMEENRQWISKVFSTRFMTHEEEIDIAMQQEGIFARDDVDTNSTTTTETTMMWKQQLLKRADESDQMNYFMGLGGMETSNAFVRYARALQMYQVPKHSKLSSSGKQQQQQQQQQQEEEVVEYMHSLVHSVYERGVAECPTVESLWLSYIRSLCESISSTTNTTSKTTNSAPSDNTKSQSKNNNSNNNSDNNKKQQQLLCIQLQSVTNRAFRNCPHSSTIVQQQLISYLYLAEYNVQVLDPDTLLSNTVQTAMDTGFLPTTTAIFDLYITATRVVKRRLLKVLSLLGGGTTIVIPADTNHKKKDFKPLGSSGRIKLLDYDDMETLVVVSHEKKQQPPKKNKAVAQPIDQDDNNNDNDQSRLQEVKDLLEDLTDMYDEIDSRFKGNNQNSSKNKNNNNEQPLSTLHRALLFQERARTEELLLKPLRMSLNNNNNNKESGVNSQEEEEEEDAIRSLWEKCIRAHNPSHPDFYHHYIQQLATLLSSASSGSSGTTSTTPSMVITNLRRIRYLYDKAITSVGNPTAVHNIKKNKKSKEKLLLQPQPFYSTTMPLRDYGIALSCLCEEWIEFEHMFGSERSLARAKKTIQKKLQKAAAAAAATSSSSTTNTTTERLIPTTLPEVDAAASLQFTEEHEMQEDESDDDHNNNNINNNNSTTTGVGTKRKGDSIKEAEDSDSRDDNVSPKRRRKSTDADDDIEAQENVVEGKKVVDLKPSMMEVDESEPSSSKQETTTSGEPMATTNKKASSSYTVKIGNLEYPAHPYTVRVSKLSPQVEDMDLIDTFRPKCGAIVHARIIRDKQPKGYQQQHQSSSQYHHYQQQHKGWGLVQFEERESVEKALELNDVISIREQLVKVERSHMPAATLVPPGMHRVRPQGEGKVSKRNQKRREQRGGEHQNNPQQQHPVKGKHDDNDDKTQKASLGLVEEAKATGIVDKKNNEETTAGGSNKKSNTSSSIGNVLAFRPRAVARSGGGGGSGRRKPKVTIEGDMASKSTNQKSESS